MAKLAVYKAIGNEVYMTDTDGNTVCIEVKKTPEAAQKSADRWNKKELKAAKKNV